MHEQAQTVLNFFLVSLMFHGLIFFFFYSTVFKNCQFSDFISQQKNSAQLNTKSLPVNPVIVLDSRIPMNGFTLLVSLATVVFCNSKEFSVGEFPDDGFKSHSAAQSWVQGFTSIVENYWQVEPEHRGESILFNFYSDKVTLIDNGGKLETKRKLKDNMQKIGGFSFFFVLFFFCFFFFLFFNRAWISHKKICPILPPPIVIFSKKHA